MTKYKYISYCTNNKYLVKCYEYFYKKMGNPEMGNRDNPTENNELSEVQTKIVELAKKVDTLAFKGDWDRGEVLYKKLKILVYSEKKNGVSEEYLTNLIVNAIPDRIPVKNEKKRILQSIGNKLKQLSGGGRKKLFVTKMLKYPNLRLKDPLPTEVW